MIQWTCIITLTVIMMVFPMLDASWTQDYHDVMSEVAICFALIGWLNSSWYNRQMMKQRIILFAFLGYTVWILVTNQMTELVAVVWQYEPYVPLTIILFALFGGFKRGKRQPHK